MCVWAEVTSRFPPVWFGNPSTAAQLPAKPPLDLPRDPKSLRAVCDGGAEEKRGGQKRRALLLFEEDFGGLKFGHRYERHHHT